MIQYAADLHRIDLWYTRSVLATLHLLKFSTLSVSSPWSRRGLVDFPVAVVVSPVVGPSPRRAGIRFGRVPGLNASSYPCAICSVLQA